MERRQFLAGAGVTVATSIAGCSGILGGGGSGGSSPVTTAKLYVEAYYEGSFDEGDELLHPDDAVPYSYWRPRGSDYTITGTEVVAEGEDETTVRVTVELSGEMWGEDTTYVHTYQLRKHQGEWWVYDVRTPVATAELFVDAIYDGDFSEAEELLHPDHTVPLDQISGDDIDYEIVSREYVEGDAERATVAMSIEVSDVWFGEEHTNTSVVFVELRTHQGMWHVHSLPESS